MTGPSRMQRRVARQATSRRGAATFDYMGILIVVVGAAAYLMLRGPLAIQAVYEMVCVLISWPFM